MTRTTPKTYRVWVVDKMIKKSYKDFQAVNAKEASNMAEREDWTDENDWKESVDHEGIMNHHIDHVEPR